MEKGRSSSTATASGSQNQSGNSMIKVNVKFGGQSVPVEISSDCTVKEFKNFLIRLTNDFPRGQKLIFKGPFLLLISNFSNYQYPGFFFRNLEFIGIFTFHRKGFNECNAFEVIRNC